MTLTVSQLNEYIKSYIDAIPAFFNICVKGEISNFTNHYKSGHFYFTLKDRDSLLKAVMFRTYAGDVRFVPQNGMKVTARGRVSVFVRDGIYQLYCEELIPDGVGDLYLAYEQLKEKLAGEGLFDDSAKKPIPEYPRKIGIVTSPTGAAIQDMLNILSRRFPVCDVELYPVLVQGDGAPKELIDGIRHFDGDADVIIIGRGGGSIEDLWAFNSEALARAIYKCKTPVISAVGHETDFTICDFVSDLRAPTPSAAAELAVPDREELISILNGYRRIMSSAVAAKAGAYRENLTGLAARRVFSSPFSYTDEKRKLLDSYCDKMTKAFVGKTDTERRKLTSETARFKRETSVYCDAGRKSLSAVCARLAALNPMSVLARGYAAVFDSDGGVVTSAKKVSAGDALELKMSDGKLDVKVTAAFHDGETQRERKDR